MSCIGCEERRKRMKAYIARKLGIKDAQEVRQTINESTAHGQQGVAAAEVAGDREGRVNVPAVPKGGSRRARGSHGQRQSQQRAEQPEVSVSGLPRREDEG